MVRGREMVSRARPRKLPPSELRSLLELNKDPPLMSLSLPKLQPDLHRPDPLA